MQGTMSIMGRDGDHKLSWDPKSPEDMKKAKEEFDNLVGESKYLAFKSLPNSNRGEQITEFDPEAQEIILVPQMVGG